MEYGIPFTITPDTGAPVLFNSFDASGVFGEECGYFVEEAQGFDGATMRQLIVDAPQRPGAFVFPAERGPQYPGLRGLIVATDNEIAFDMEQNLRRLFESMRFEWATMSWTNSDGLTRQVRVTGINLGVQGSIPKEFLLQMVSDQAQKDGDTLHSVTMYDDETETVSNAGDMYAWAVGQLYGPFTSCQLTDVDTGVVLDIFGTISEGDYIDLDMLRDTLYVNGDLTRFVGSYLTDVADFFPLLPGEQDISFTAVAGSTGVTRAVLYWRDGWA